MTPMTPEEIDRIATVFAHAIVKESRAGVVGDMTGQFLAIADGKARFDTLGALIQATGRLLADIDDDMRAGAVAGVCRVLTSYTEHYRGKLVAKPPGTPIN